MNRGLVNLAELRENFAQADFKQGKSSYCFINGDKVIKIYAPKYGDFLVPDKICDLSMFKADTIVFPLEYIYENGKIVGEISKYINSKPISESFNEKANIKTIINSYEAVISDLYLYSNIDMMDLCFVNILYSNRNGFHLIDTTEWNFKENPLKENIRRFNMSLLDAVIEFSDIPITYGRYYNHIYEKYLDNLAKYGKAGKELETSMYALMSDKYNFLKFLYAYMNVYQIHYSEEAKTLNDIKELTKVLKKG